MAKLDAVLRAAQAFLKKADIGQLCPRCKGGMPRHERLCIRAEPGEELERCDVCGRYVDDEGIALAKTCKVVRIASDDE